MFHLLLETLNRTPSFRRRHQNSNTETSKLRNSGGKVKTPQNSDTPEFCPGALKVLKSQTLAEKFRTQNQATAKLVPTPQPHTCNGRTLRRESKLQRSCPARVSTKSQPQKFQARNRLQNSGTTALTEFCQSRNPRSSTTPKTFARKSKLHRKLHRRNFEKVATTKLANSETLTEQPKLQNASPTDFSQSLNPELQNFKTLAD